MEEYLEQLARRIRFSKQELIHDGDAICASLESTLRQLKGSLDDPTDYVVCSLGELQSNGTIFDAKCAALAMQVRMYKELLSNDVS